MADKDVLEINEKAQERLVRYVLNAVMLREVGWQLRNRLIEVDRAYMREFDYTEAQQKARIRNQSGDPTKIQNMQVPLAYESVETTVGFLTNVFLTDYPMYKFVAEPEKQDLALMWNTLVGEDQINYGWIGEFNKAFRNGAKYNFSPIECEWHELNKYKPVNGTGKNGVVLEQQIYAGNRILSLDPYNTIYDPRVDIHKVHEEGEFAGYVKMVSRIGLKRFLANLGDKRLKNDKKAFESPEWNVEYFTPYINPTVTIRNNNSPWMSGTDNFNWFAWATDEAQKHIAYKNMYTVTTLYARIMPYEFGIKAPRDQTPDIWKLIVVNGVLVYAQPMINAHDLLPIVIAQPLVDNLSHQTKSQVENVLDFQYMESALLTANLASARRRITDRMLYNPLLVDPDHINSPNPAAKIPLRPTAYGRKLEEAVYQIPFQDQGAQSWIQEAAVIDQWAKRVQGQNNVSQGQFQKGNKLQDEFNTVMANANSRDRTQAIMWEAYAMQPIKVILKSNYLQMTPKGERYNRTEETIIDIDPVELRKTVSDFEVGDGLLPTQKLMRSDVMEQGFLVMSQNPAIGQEYNVGDLFSYMMKLNGVDKLTKFQKTPEQKQYEQQMATWQQVLVEYAKLIGKPKDPSGVVWTMEDAQKAAGPMPQPPQPKQAPQQP